MAERVVRGEVTPNAAALEKGWRKPRIVVTSPESVAREPLSLRFCHTAPSAAPSTTTVATRMNQVRRVKTTPIVPYSLCSEMSADEKHALSHRGRALRALVACVKEAEDR